MKILLSLCGNRNKASSRVRGYWIAEELEVLGNCCRITVTDSKLKVMHLLLQLQSADVVIFQKVYSRDHYCAMRLARLLGKRVYLDIDDAPSRVRDANTLKYFAAMAKSAHAVFAGSHELASYVRSVGGRPVLIPTGIRLKEYRPRSFADGLSSPVTVGWIGNGRHYENDLCQLLLPALKSLSRSHAIKLLLIGCDGCESLRENLLRIPRIEVEFRNNVDWSREGASAESLRGVDIGVYPLIDNDFNRYKCGFKALEYMACAIPVVASDNSANREIIEHDFTGYLVSTASEWRSALEALVRKPQLRAQMGKKGREKVVRDFDTTRIAGAISAVWSA